MCPKACGAMYILSGRTQLNDCLWLLFFFFAMQRKKNSVVFALYFHFYIPLAFFAFSICIASHLHNCPRQHEAF
jgi:hypothetical protein